MITAKRLLRPVSILTPVALFLFSVMNVCAQKDPCDRVNVQLANGDPPTYTLAEIAKQPKCFDGRFVEILGIYRIFFENSDLYDADDPTARAWVSFDEFSAAVRQCGTPGASKAFNRKYGGTWGLKALGIIRTSGRYGHMSGWPMGFQVICIENDPLLAKPGAVFDALGPRDKKTVLDWYKAEIKKLY